MKKKMTKLGREIRKLGGQLMRDKHHQVWQMPDGYLLVVSHNWNSPKLFDLEAWKRRNERSQ